MQSIKRIAQLSVKGDRIVIYFSGHGFYVGGDNYLAPVDASKTAVTDTCISISTILGILNNSESTQKVLLLDCCHSGFEAGDATRDSDDTFMTEELLLQFRNEEFCVGFASCKNDQKSISHPKLRNGVWSHFLIKALTGDAAGIYRNNILFSDALQSYLNKQTSEFVKLNTTAKRDQTPIKFGSETDNFIVADLSELFEERDLSRAHEDIPFPSISILTENEVSVRSLPGFKSSFHHIPTEFGNNQNNFIKSVGTPLIEQEISKLGVTLVKTLKYKRTEINVQAKSGTIATIDFDYEMSIKQSQSKPYQYILTRELRNFKNSARILKPEFNEVFSDHFNILQFENRRSISIEDLIDRIEAINPNTVSVDYDPSDITWCKIIVPNLEFSINVTETEIKIGSGRRASPLELIEAYRSTAKALAQRKALRLLD